MSLVNSYHWFLPYAVILPSFQSIWVLKSSNFPMLSKFIHIIHFILATNGPFCLFNFNREHNLILQIGFWYMVNYTCSTCYPCMIQSIYIGPFCPKTLIFIDVCSHFIQLLIIVSLWSISSICYTSIVKNYWRFYFIHVCQLWFIWQSLFISSHPPLFQLLFCPYLLSSPFPFLTSFPLFLLSILSLKIFLINP